jgi:hypothetical protein
MRTRAPRRPWYRSYFPGWWAFNPGSGGGGGTVTTDGVTIQGNGSGGSPIALLAVETDATLTGAGVVGNTLKVATPFPGGWPLAFYSQGQGSANQLVQFANANNTLNVYGFSLLAQVRFSNITVYIGTADNANNCDLGLYNSSGTLVAHIGAQHLPATNNQTFAIVGAPITLNPGIYFFATTSVATTAAIYISGGNAQAWAYSLNTSYGASVGGALPASIAAPAASVQSVYVPSFALS